MTISFWRYSHLVLAISSSLFLLIASITGVILAFEPIIKKAQPYQPSGASELTIAELLSNVEGKYEEVLSISSDKNGFITASVIGENGSKNFYIDPFTGEKIGELKEKAAIFNFATSLHRSLFLGTIGRFFIGLASFLLFLMATSGVALILRRQGGIKQFFNKLVKTSFLHDYHTILGRLALIPLIVISLSGTYLSLLRFSIIPEENISHAVDYDAIEASPKISTADFKVFNQNTLENFRSIEFPFSDDVEDYFLLKLKKKEVIVNQFTGEALSEQPYPFVALFSELAMMLHTGQGTILWSVVLGLASLTLPFFIYSGFAITLKRRAAKIKNPYPKDQCKYVILVGSEGGTTRKYAKLLHDQLLAAKQTSYLTDMNKLSHFKQMEHLVVITATYGQGEAPSNAAQFKKLFIKDFRPKNDFTFSVVGFGSLAYPEFCKFAFDTDDLLRKHPLSTQLLEVHTVNNQSFEAFSSWINPWAEKVGLTIELPKPDNLIARKKTQKFTVVNRAISSNVEDNTALIELKQEGNKKFESGDLLAIYPENSTRERLYSLGKSKDGNLLLSVKKHELGLCSTLLHELKIGDSLEGFLLENKAFHFPKKAKRTIMISNGTGIAPFLGMINRNGKAHEIHLYWGGRTGNSFDIYKETIEGALADNQLTTFKPAYSRCCDKIYVQSLIEKDAPFIAQTLKDNGTIMICGSITMQKGVTQALDQICQKHNNQSLSFYQNRKQIKLDCY